MEALFIFIAKSTGLIVLFYTTYYFLLRKETFFNSNRWFLLAGLITSVVLPFLVYTKVIWVKADSELNLNYAPLNTVQNLEKSAFEINWNYVFLAIYIIGFLALMIKFAMDFYSLNSILKGKKIQQQADFKFIDVEENIAPFSYFEYIVYNSSMYSASELESIIEHEKVHSDQNHTVDVLISRVFCVLFWFNPIIWLYKKAIAQNLEFIADKEAAQKIADKKAYQYTLLKITTHESCLSITNHFYQSLIKKRIVMLNKNQSKKRNSWKYYVVVPALAAFVLLFQVVIAKERQEIIKKVSDENTAAVSKEDPGAIHVYKIKKETTNEELETITQNLKKIHDLDFTVSDIKRNSDNDITSIKADLKNGAEEVQTLQVKGNKGIKDCGIVVVIDEKGERKINLITDGQPYGVTVKNKAKIVEVNNVQNSKTNTNVNTNCTTDTKTDGNTNTHTTVVISNNVNETTSPNVVISTKTRTKSYGVPNLIIVDGVVVSPRVNIDDLKSLDIESMHVWKGPEAILKFGDQGKDGVIEVETKK